MQKSMMNIGPDHCQLEVIASFKKGETILALGDHTGRCGILRSGEAHISSVNEAGQENLLETLRIGESFGELYIPPCDQENISVIADSDAEVLFINMKNVLNGCGKDCDHHLAMMRTLLLMSSRHSQEQAIHLNVLSQRTLRDKLLTYLQYIKEDYPEEVIQLPMNLVSLANYLCVDRSAMMREIKKMNQEGIIRSSGRNFCILEKEEHEAAI